MEEKFLILLKNEIGYYIMLREKSLVLLNNEIGYYIALRNQIFDMTKSNLNNESNLIQITNQIKLKLVENLEPD